MAKRKRKSRSQHPKLPNGFGRITEIKNKNLRNPFRAMITIGRNEEGSPIGKILGYYPDWYAAYEALAEYHKNPYELERKTTTIEDLYRRWYDSYTPETDETYVRTINSAWSYVPAQMRRQNAAAIQPQMLLDCIKQDAQIIGKDGKPKKASVNIQSRMKSMFNLMYDYAVLAGVVSVNPARQFSLKGIQEKIEKQREEKIPFSPAHEAELWKDIEFGYTRMILINIYSGWRPQEMILLEKSSIDWNQMTMIGGMKTAAGENRTVPIHPKIADLLRYYYDNTPGERLFYSDQIQPRPLTYDQYRKRFEKIMARHGWPDYTPSCPRHTFATKAKERKMDETAKKLIMGHEITDVTEKHYTHIDKAKFLSDEILKI